MGKIRWLHISDLHYDREMMGDWPAGQNGFPVTGIDFIVFTGDMHTYGRDYNEGKRFLTELAKHYNLNPSEDIFIVPGNHDVDPYRVSTKGISAVKLERGRRAAERNAKKATQVVSKSFDDFAIDRLKHLRNAPSDVLNADGSHLSHRFSEYCEAVESICGPAPFSRDRDPFAYAGAFCRKWKNRINLIHVNSALLSCSDTYRAQILDICAINDLSYNPAFNRALPTIILAHHNYAELAAIQREALKPILAGLNVRAYLNGDCHQRGEDNILLDGGRAIPCFTAPSIYKAQGDDAASIGFYLYEMDTDSPQWRVNVTSYPNAGTPKVFICAMHPTNPECADLLSKKDSDLKKIIETRDIPCEDKTRNAAMRTAIWSYYGDDLQVNSVELDVTKGDAKPIWEKLQKYLPVYSLFQADRKNSDSDSEVQDPLHAAVKEILQDEGISQTLDHVAEIVEGKLQEVATRTLEKLREMSPDIANTLSPVIPPASSLKWADVFKSVTISGDESIPINKRGSGSKRLILLNFFRAEVERRKDEANAPSIIYAIEEPETSQHSENQKKLINALIALSTESNVQVIVTTHSAVLVNALDFKNIRLICADGSQKRVEAVRSGQLPFPSLNEVNYLAFSEISEGYHDELYGYLEEQGWLNEYKQGKTTVPYKKISANGTTREQQICMTEYIRHQIHHPENTYNARFNDSQLRRSIEDMRAFVTSKAQTPETT